MRTYLQGTQLAKTIINHESKKVGGSLIAGAFAQELRHKENIVAGSHGFTESSVTSENLIDFHSHGVITNTEQDTNFAIQGNGWFVCKNNIGNYVLSRQGDFMRTGSNGELVNSSGATLMMQYYDDNGRAPVGSDRTTLSAFAYDARRQASAQETNSIQISANVNASARGIKGSGQEMRISSNSINNNHINRAEQLIMPEDSKFGAITQGTEMTIRTGTDEVKVEYGGITVSRSARNGLFGVRGVNDKFDITQHKLTGITFVVGVTGRQDVVLRFNAHNAGNNLEFNSLSSLKDALNKIGGVRAEINGDRLVVGTTNGNDGITFTSSSNKFLPELGIQTILAAADGVNRWNSMRSLQKHLVNTGRFKATSERAALDIFVANASDTIQFTGSSQGWHQCRYAYMNGENYVDLTVGRANNRMLTIDSPDHGLEDGDVVTLDNLAVGNVAGAIFNNAGSPYLMVKKLDGDRFAVYSNAPSGITIAAAPVGFDVQGNHQISTQAFNWKKVIHKEYADIKANVTAVAVQGATALRITCPNDFENGDTIFLELDATGDAANNARSGYFIVANRGVANFDLVAAGEGNIGAGLTQANIKSLRLVKAANALGSLYALDGKGSKNIGFSAIAVESKATNEIKVYVPEHFGVLSHISFSGLIPHMIVDNGTNNDIIVNDTQYEIINRGDGYVTIKVPTFTAIHDNSGGGGVDSGTAGAVGEWAHFTYADDAAANANGLGDFSINRTTSFANFFGMNDNGKVIKQAYDPTDTVRSIQSGNLKPLDDLSFFNNVINIYKKDGEAKKLNINMVKTSDYRWAIEIYAKENSDGSYDVMGTDGAVASGYITFNSDGTVQNISPELKRVTVDFTDGTTSTFNLDLDKTDNTSGITQLATNNELIETINDGMSVGYLQSGGVKIKENGDVYYSYTNGSVKKIGKIPFAFVSDTSQLKNVDGGYISREADWILKNAGENGMGCILQNYLDHRSLNMEEIMTAIMQASNISKTSSTVFSIYKQATDYLFQKA